MKTLNFKIAAIAALLVAFIAFAMHYDHLKEKAAKQKDKIAEQSGEIEAKDNLIKKERSLAYDAAKREQKTADDLKVKQDEFKKLRDCFDAGKCVVKLRGSPKETTSRVPNTSGSGSESSSTNAEYTRRLEQDYIRLTETIGLVEVNYAALQRELIARSDKDYCNPSKLPLSGVSQDGK